MKKMILCSMFLIMASILGGCGQDGAAVAGGASGSTIESVNADCDGQPCI